MAGPNDETPSGTPEPGAAVDRAVSSEVVALGGEEEGSSAPDAAAGRLLSSLGSVNDPSGVMASLR